MLFSRKSSLFGLDIGSSAVKLVELREGKGGFELVSFGMAALPPEAIVDGALIDATTVIDTIEDLVKTHQVKATDVATSVSGHSLIIRKINLPVMSQEELEESIQWEAEQYIPFEISDVNLDFQILGPVPGDQTQMEVLLVAAKKELINDYVDVIREAGLSPVVVDVDAFAIENMYEINYPVVQDEVLALIDIGASVMNINFTKGGVSNFTRDVSFGGNQYNEEIQKKLNLSYQDAEAAKVGQDVEGVNQRDVEKIIAGVNDALIGEIQRSIQFFSSSAGDDRINKVVLSGGCSRARGLTQAMQDKLGLPVEIANPFNAIQCDPGKFDAEYLNSVGPAAAVAIGLALRRLGDKV